MKKLWGWLRNVDLKVVIPLFLILVVFVVNAFHEKYPDEFDSLVGGKYILEAKIPYRDWFQHHQPGAYVLSALLLPFAQGSFVKMRVLIGMSFFAIIAATYFLIKKRVPVYDSKYYLFFAGTLAVSGTYFWGQMLLADTLAAYLFIPAYTLLLLKDYYRLKFDKTDLAIVTFCAFLVWFTSMTYLFAISGIILYAIYLYTKWMLSEGNSYKEIALDVIRIVALPYILYFLFWTLTGSLKDWYFANITYNQEYYIFNYPRAPGAHFNPIRYAVIIANTFMNNYLPALWGVLQFPIGDPLQVTLAMSNAVFLIVLILSRRSAFILPFIIALIFSNGRSNPQQIKETDYWASVYIALSFINGTFSLAALTSLVNQAKELASVRLISGVLLVITWIYWIFMPTGMFLRMEDKFYPKYMGEAPLIYDRPQVVHMVNQLVSKDEYAWIGPFNFEELFYLKAKIPTKHHWFLDPAAKSKIKDEIIRDLNAHMPKVVVFQRNYTPWGGDARTFNYFVIDFLDKNYFRIFKLNETLTDVQYKWKVNNTQNFDIDGDFNFDKRYQKELLEKLISLGYLEAVPTSKDLGAKK